MCAFIRHLFTQHVFYPTSVRHSTKARRQTQFLICNVVEFVLRSITSVPNPTKAKSSPTVPMHEPHRERFLPNPKAKLLDPCRERTWI